VGKGGIGGGIPRPAGGTAKYIVASGTRAAWWRGGGVVQLAGVGEHTWHPGRGKRAGRATPRRGERRGHAGECEGEAAAGLVLWEHGVRVGLALGGVGGGDRIDDRLGLLVADFCRRGNRLAKGRDQGRGLDDKKTELKSTARRSRWDARRTSNSDTCARFVWWSVERCSTYSRSSLQHCAGGSGRCYAPCARSWSRA
jgi:hypothetical protein